jgi:hypothetical protein
MQTDLFMLKPLTRAAQNETDQLLEQVFVYDFVEQANLGW